MWNSHEPTLDCDNTLGPFQCPQRFFNKCKFSSVEQKEKKYLTVKKLAEKLIPELKDFDEILTFLCKTALLYGNNTQNHKNRQVLACLLKDESEFFNGA